MRRFLSLAALLAVLLAAPAIARERLLTPSDDWQIVQSDQSCTLSRNFSDPNGAPLRLDIEAFQPGSPYKILMVGDALPLRDGVRRGVGNMKYRFKPDPKWREAAVATGYLDGEDALSFQTDIATQAETTRLRRLSERSEPTGMPPYSHDTVRAAQISHLSLAYPARDDTVLQLGQMSEPLLRLSDCAWEVFRSWGYDRAELERLASLPQVQNGAEIGSEILREMFARKLGHNAGIHFRLDVAEDGSVTECSIQAPRRESDVEALICRILSEKSVILPARDAAGKPVRAPLISRVVFGVS